RRIDGSWEVKLNDTGRRAAPTGDTVGVTLDEFLGGKGLVCREVALASWTDVNADDPDMCPVLHVGDRACIKTSIAARKHEKSCMHACMRTVYIYVAVLYPSIDLSPLFCSYSLCFKLWYTRTAAGGRRVDDEHLTVTAMADEPALLDLVCKWAKPASFWA
ncbi:Os08g0352250, partial [Oryza sativa Japonica Group]